MEMEFDFEEFRNRCVLEFCELRDDPVQVLKYHKNKTMKHYAPGVDALRLSQWDNAQSHVLNQTHFAAPFVFDKDVSFGIIDMHRPLMVIKFGNEIYWRAVPKDHCEVCIKIAKEKNIYAKLRTIPLPKRTKVKAESVESFLDRCRLETITPPQNCKIHLVKSTLADHCILHTNYFWHHTAIYIIKILEKLHLSDIDGNPYWHTMPHMKKPGQSDYVVFQEPFVGLFVEYRVNRNFYHRGVPKFLEDQMIVYAKSKQRLFRSPSFLLNKGGSSTVDYLKQL